MMENQFHEKRQALELRRKAESQFAAASDAGATRPLASAFRSDTATAISDAHQRLLHELQVHQVELELQNAALRDSQEALEASRDSYVELYENSPLGYISLSAAGLIEQINQTCALMLGRERAQLIQKPFSALVVAEDRDLLVRLLLGVKRDGKRRSEVRLKRSNGSSFVAQLDCLRDECGSGARRLPPGATPTQPVGGRERERERLYGIRIALSDVSERKRAEEKLKLAASVFANAREGIMITTTNGLIVDVNAAFSRITGYSHDEAVGHNPRLLSSHRHDKSFYRKLWQDLTKDGHWYGEIWNRRKNGEIYAEFQSISAVRDAQGIVRQYVSLFSDITAQKEHEQQLEHLAHFDVLTNLPNRALLGDRLRQAITQTQRRNRHLAVTYIDLDGFKQVNDTHGHEIGDRLLIAVVARIKDALREGDTMARLGGDEFVVVLLDLENIAASVPLLNRMLTAAAQPVHLDALVLQISASLGVTFYPQNEDPEVDADRLLRQADQAMYQAKENGKNRYHVFDEMRDRSVRGHHESLERIRRGLEQHEFSLHYQPKVNMRSGAVIGAEALIRWAHPDRGMLLPAVFLPVIEDHPLAVEIGEWVIVTALAQIEAWHAIGIDLPVSINVGARQLQESGFVERLKGRLAAHPTMNPDRLQLEVLETSALSDLACAAQVIDRCRALGLGFALDDFGTGYSSLTYLKRLAVNLLKIDQSFVIGMLGDPDDRAILEGIIGLATACRRGVIAEGVETIEHGEMLLQLGCDLAQGYGIARPMPASEFPAWIAGWRPDPSWHDQTLFSLDDLPLSIARVEHRAWISEMARFLDGERATAPLLDQQDGRFGAWLEEERLRRHGNAAGVQAIVPLHRQIQAAATTLDALQRAKRYGEAREKLGELRRLRTRLLEQIRALA